MAKILGSLSNIDHLLGQFKLALEGYAGGSFNIDGFTVSPSTVNKKTTLCFSETAWMKMQKLISEFQGEVGWHATAEKQLLEGDKDGKIAKYFVKDVFVYPQMVTSATVTTDQKDYMDWLYAQPDEIFNQLKFHGHSHVNMPTSPSSVDEAWYDEIIDQQRRAGKGFYVFMIENKKHERYIRIYDFDDSLMYETKDIDVTILQEAGGLMEFIDDAKEVAKNKPATPAKVSPYASPYGGYGYNYRGAYGYNDDYQYEAKSPSDYKTKSAFDRARKQFNSSGTVNPAKGK